MFKVYIGLLEILRGKACSRSSAGVAVKICKKREEVADDANDDDADADDANDDGNDEADDADDEQDDGSDAASSRQWSFRRTVGRFARGFYGEDRQADMGRGAEGGGRG